MNKYFFCLILLFTAFTVAAQKKESPVKLIQSETETGIKLNGKDIYKVYKPVFEQDYSTLRSDSAYFYPQDNAFDAFGHVVVTQGDTLHIYSDKLNYSGNTKIAILTDNVKMVDRDATLTTNNFTYNTGTRIGTYIDGGKLVNKDNTLTSKNGFYFSNSRDAYFRYDVVLKTVDALIKNDTLRYNSGTRIAFFYGPTNIYGKDKDTLYTENGTYNTITEQAFFGKNNLYKQGTKSLKGDSLFYDRLKQYGRAIKHVTFADRSQKVIIKGDLGVYTKEDERTVMTIHPYVVFVTEEAAKTDTSPTKKDTIAANKGSKAVVKNNKAKKDTLAVNKNIQALIKNIPTTKDTTGMSKDIQALVKNNANKKDTLAVNNIKTIIKNNATKKDTLAVKAGINTALNKIKTGKIDSLIPKNSIPIKIKDITDATPDSSDVAEKGKPRIKRDSIFMSGDTIETQIITYQELRYIQEIRHIVGMKDSTLKSTVSMVYTKPVKFLTLNPPNYFNNKDFLHPDYFPKPVVVQDTSEKAKAALAKKLAKAKLNKQNAKVDSVYLSQKINLSDTAKVRILIAAHHAKIFKSDLQAKADSIFYSYADSTARMFVRPIIWTENSQLSGDTVDLQLKNKKVDNIELFPKGLIVNIEKKDSTHFNQIGGRKMRGFFRNSKLYVVYVDGNAETIFYKRDSIGVTTELAHSISSRVRVNFKENKPVVGTWYTKPEIRDTPIAFVKDENKTLKDFQWKPKQRPVSKEAVISPPPEVPDDDDKPKGKNIPKGKKPETKANVKPGAAVIAGTKLKTDSVKAKADIIQQIKTKPDSLNRIKPKTDSIKVKADTTKQIKIKPDTLNRPKLNNH